jgi:hypothetical protein
VFLRTFLLPATNILLTIVIGTSQVAQQSVLQYDFKSTNLLALYHQVALALPLCKKIPLLLFF